MPLVVHGSVDGTVTGTHRTGIFWGHHLLDRSSCVVVVVILLLVSGFDSQRCNSRWN